MANYFLPGIAGQISTDDSAELYEQKAPINNLYSPRLFGAPNQFTNQCDMRIKSSLGVNPGPVGDWYLDNIIQSAQVCNFVVGHARFDGGFNTLTTIIRNASIYANALHDYRVFDKKGDDIRAGGDEGNIARAQLMDEEYMLDTYKSQLGVDGSASTTTTASTEGATTSDAQTELNTNIQTQSSSGQMGAEDGTYALDVYSIQGAEGIFDQIANMFKQTGFIGGVSVLKDAFSTGHKLQKSFYTFEADWTSYIENVRMMINTAIVMLGLSDGQVRIGDELWPINTTEKLKETDVWSNYRFITPSEKVGNVNAVDTMSGEFNQYVSFMTEPVQIQENYQNQTGTSQIYGNVIQSGETLGNEIAFITNSSANMIDDAVVNLAGQGINMAEKVLQNLTLGTGKFTAAILGSMARSYTGDHTIFPEIFTSHQSTSTVSLNIKLRASGGDPYTYLMEILVPIFHLMAMAIPQMAKGAASAYSYPPLVQLNIPGVWGTRLGIIESLSIAKQGNDYSVNGYPLAVDIGVQVKDLQHVIMSSGMHQKAQMLNNDTMFDYIAQCAGVDKYRANPAIRVVTKMILSAAAGQNFVHNLGTAIKNWGTSIVNRYSNIRNQ